MECHFVANPGRFDPHRDLHGSARYASSIIKGVIRMAIEELISIVTPPAEPVESGDDAHWNDLQAELGIRLPDDFRDFGRKYGSGTIHDRGRLDVYVYQPFAASFQQTIETHAAILSSYRCGEGPDYIPYEVFPNSPGLLAWGGDVNGNELWAPDEWPVVTRSETDEFEEFPGPMTSFLARAFNREILVGIWPEPFFLEPAEIFFESETVTKPVEPASVYDLYARNGNKADFWVRKTASQSNVAIHIKSINGQTAGRVPGITDMNAIPRVVADLYIGGSLFESEINMNSAYHLDFIAVDSPLLEDA